MKSKPKPKPRTRPPGFTLIELLVVVTIILVLALLGFMGAKRFIDNAKKTQALSQFRDFRVGLTMFEMDYRIPPTPSSKRGDGWDTIYGDPGGNYDNAFLVATLAGDEQDYSYGDENFSAKEANPRLETYIRFPLAQNGRGGVGEDGRLYDPWGHEIMIAVNGFQGTGSSIVDFNNGSNDRRLHTWGLAEYAETKPKDESFVFWSYGKDGKKGDNAPNNSDVVSLQKSDDVVSW